MNIKEEILDRLSDLKPYLQREFVGKKYWFGIFSDETIIGIAI